MFHVNSWRQTIYTCTGQRKAKAVCTRNVRSDFLEVKQWRRSLSPRYAAWMSGTKLLIIKQVYTKPTENGIYQHIKISLYSIGQSSEANFVLFIEKTPDRGESECAVCHYTGK